MTRRYTGGFLSATEQVTDANTANGIFSVQDAGALTAAGSFPTGRWTPQRSLRFRASNQNYLNRTFGAPTNNKVWTWSAWVKRGSLSLADADHLFMGTPTDVGGNPSTYSRLVFETDGTLRLQSNASASEVFTSSGLFRDSSAWYHIVLYMDAVNTTVRCYVNGTEIEYASKTNPTNVNTAINGSGNYHRMGFFRTAEPRPMDGYMADVNFIDGQALTPSAFGFTDPETGTWVPKRYTGTYGNNGFYLDFRDPSAATATAIGADRSGNSNNWTPNNIALSGVTSTTTSYTSVGTTTWTPPANVSSVSYLVVAGGGAGGSAGPTMYDGGAAGGGAGGMLQGTLAVTPGTPYTITVGGGASGAANRTRGASGSNSVFGSLTAIGGGGGGGGANTTSGANGGSGGGGANGGAAGTGTAGQGNDGGFYVGSPGNGGGGRGSPGGSATNNNGAAGGTGTASDISGSTVTYAAGGGGGGYQLSGGAGGSSIGGAGGNNNANGSNATSYGSGGGGSGGTYNTTGTLTGGNGSQGIVIISYSVPDSTYDSMVDVPGIASTSSQTDFGGVTRGNYATLNPLNKSTGGGTLSEANLRWTTSGGNHTVCSSMAFPSSGKWYFEATDTVTGGNSTVGIFQQNQSLETNVISANINMKYNGMADNATFGFAVDMDNLTYTWYKNGVVASTGSASTGSLAKDVTYVAFCMTSSGGGASTTFNFGQRPFKYAPPVGHKSLCTTNLPTPLIKRPVEHFDVKTYVGNGSSLQVGATQKQASAYAINKSLKFREAAGGHLARTPATTSNQKTFTISAWVKLSKTSSAKNYIYTTGNAGAISTNYTLFDMQASGFSNSVNYIEFISALSNSTICSISTTPAFNDTTSWQHVMVAVDTTQAAARNRVKIYQNGKQITDLRASTFPSKDVDIPFINNSSYEQYIGKITTYGNYDGYMAEYNFIDGQQLTPASFGLFDAYNNWVPQRYAGTYGTNGFYLPMDTTASGFSGYYGDFNLTSTAQYLSVANSAPVQYGTGDFTQECFFQLNSYPASDFYCIFGAYSSSGHYVLIGSDGKLNWGINGAVNLTSLQPVTRHQWNHVAVVRASGNLTVYLNGRLIANSIASSGNVDPGAEFRIGSLSSGYPRLFPGRISNFRMVKGTALYTSDFTPPTTTLTAVTNTSLLLLTGSSVTTDGSTNNFTVTNTGTVVSKAGNDVGAYVKAFNDASGNNKHWTPYVMTVEPAAVKFMAVGTTTWTAPPGVTSVNYLVVAGGGGGGVSYGCGGGAGGLLQGKMDVTPGTSYTVTVGGGGAQNTNGSNSVFSTLTSVGGGKGAHYSARTAGNGGSGGGGYGAGGAAGTGTAGQGNNGGAGAADDATYSNGGGGGGAGAVGGTASPNASGAGGIGLASAITGSSVYYAGGGGGGGSTGSAGAGGTGGGGAGSVSTAGAAGTANTGGGGGGGYTSTGSGGSGIVILSYGAGNDSTYDTPTDNNVNVLSDNGGTGNFATWSAHDGSGGTRTLSNANLDITIYVGATYPRHRSNMEMTFGKWYAEFTCTSEASGGGRLLFGVSAVTQATASGSLGYYSNEYAYYTAGSFYSNNTNPATGLTSAPTGAIVQLAYDRDLGKLWVGVNGTWLNSGDPSTGTSPAFNIPTDSTSAINYFTIGSASGTSGAATANFGQQNFAFTPPTGFKALNSKNLKDAGSYNLPDTFGNFVNTPDLVWLKNRTSGSYGHRWTDTVRGATRQLLSHDTGAQTTDANGLQAFLPNGFQLGSGGDYNVASNNFVAWSWNRGRTPGFDIVNYTASGATKSIPHNLGVAPKFIIIKDTTSVENWQVYHESIGPQYNIYLNTIAGTVGPSSTYWGGISPTSTDFTVGSWQTADTHIAYLWAEVPGFSKFGSYTGNNANDGPFVYLGFRPRFILLKKSGEASTSYGWQVYDTARSPINVAYLPGLWADQAVAEAPNTYAIDLVSNGFKLKSNNLNMNNTSTFIYAAFAETPFKYANAR